MIYELSPQMLAQAHYFYSEISPGVSVMFAVPHDLAEEILRDPQYLTDLQSELDDLTRFMRSMGWYLRIRRRYADVLLYKVQLQAEINLVKQVMKGLGE